MNGAWLIVLLILIRFVLLGVLNPQSLKLAQHFAPLSGKEKWAYWVYQMSTLILIGMPIFLSIQPSFLWLSTGVFSYLLGLFILAGAVFSFARPRASGIRLDGIYKVSRNPMYLGYFFSFVGIGLVTQSLFYLAIVLVFQISTHWIILAEERWCVQQFGEEYRVYMHQVRRYI